MLLLSRATIVAYPGVQNRLLNAAVLLVWVCLDIQKQVIQCLGLGGAVLLQQILERHHDVSVGHCGQIWRLRDV